MAKTVHAAATAANVPAAAPRAAHIGEFAKLEMCMTAAIAAPHPSVAAALTGSALRPSELKRRKCVWTVVDDGITAPVVRDYRGIASTIREAAAYMGGETFRFSVVAKAKNAVKFYDAAVLTGIVGAWVTQRADGSIRVAADCSTPEECRRVFLTAQALVAIADRWDGYAAQCDIHGALDGVGVHGNYNPRRAGIDSFSYRY